MEIGPADGEPELRVDGVPFFIHAAQFDYFRIPPDLWPGLIRRYRELGINTIDLRIPWNWHEPSDGLFDFDGHSNSRRNLRRLLKIIVEAHLKLVARPGPIVGDYWRNAGYPLWLLAGTGFGMSASAIDRGDAPPAAELAARDANAAAREWLSNEAHLTRARRWMTAVAGELAPYRSKSLVSISDYGGLAKGAPEKQGSGPLLLVVLDDAASVRPGSDISDLQRYLGELRKALVAGGLDAMTVANAPRAGLQGVESLARVSSRDSSAGIGFAGEWFITPPRPDASKKPVLVRSPLTEQSVPFTAEDASALALLVSSLGTQPDFPPYISGFAATTPAPSGDTRAIQPPLEDTLLASRILLGTGARGITYSPLQDTVTPAGWETPAAARFLRWDNALDLAGNPKPLAGGVSRNGQFVAGWSAMLASSHLGADFGVVDLRDCVTAAGEAENLRISRGLQQFLRLSVFTGFTPELVNPAVQPVERLLRDRVIVLALPPGDDKSSELTEKAQQGISEFVRRGGALIFFPSPPKGTLLESWWKGAARVPSPDKNFNEWRFEQGRLIASSNDFFFEASPAEEPSQDRSRPEDAAAIDSLTTLLKQSGVSPAIRRAGGSEPNPNLFVTQLVSNGLSNPSGHLEPCPQNQLCAAGLVAVTNLSPDEPASESFEIRDPRRAGGASVPEYIPLKLTIPAHDSLLVPVHASLCSAASASESCSDDVITAGAELLGAMRDGKTLELTFYAPARATVRLHLDGAPLRVELGDDIRPEYHWKQDTGELEVTLLRGAAPEYRRVLKIQLRYAPRVKEKPDPKKSGRDDMEYKILDAMRVPLGGGLSLPTAPPLVSDDAVSSGVVIGAWNHSENARAVDFELDGAFRGSVATKVYGGDQETVRMRIQRSPGAVPGKSPPAGESDGLLHGNVTIRAGQKTTTGTVLFLNPDEAGNSHYQFDFDMDGAPEWVLESNRLRLIVSPANAGRAFALIDKSTNDNLITLDGAFHDFAVPAGTAPPDAQDAGDFASNRAYQAEWAEEKQDAGIKLSYPGEKSEAGIHVEKTLRLATSEVVEAVYRASRGAPDGESTSEPAAPRSFISGLSVPRSESEEGTDRVCWRADSAMASEGSVAVAKPAEDERCEDLVPMGSPIDVPEGVSHAEIHSTGRTTIFVEWTAGRVTVVPKLFSSQINLVIPMPPGDTPAEFTLRYGVAESRK